MGFDRGSGIAGAGFDSQRFARAAGHDQAQLTLGLRNVAGPTLAQFAIELRVVGFPKKSAGLDRGEVELAVFKGEVHRAIARGVYAATKLPFPGAAPAWQDRFR